MNYYPPVSFHFSVYFDLGGAPDARDVRFQSVSGLNIEVETESMKEGGENRFVHTLPVRTKFNNLVLKRGMFTDSKLIKWCLDTFRTLDITPADVIISLLNENHVPLKSWKIKHAWPVKWQVEDFSAEDNKLVIESIELAYHYFTTE